MESFKVFHLQEKVGSLLYPLWSSSSESHGLSFTYADNNLVRHDCTENWPSLFIRVFIFEPVKYKYRVFGMTVTHSQPCDTLGIFNIMNGVVMESLDSSKKKKKGKRKKGNYVPGTWDYSELLRILRIWTRDLRFRSSVWRSPNWANNLQNISCQP